VQSLLRRHSQKLGVPPMTSQSVLNLLSLLIAIRTESQIVLATDGLRLVMETGTAGSDLPCAARNWTR